MDSLYHKFWVAVLGTWRPIPSKRVNVCNNQKVRNIHLALILQIFPSLFNSCNIKWSHYLLLTIGRSFLCRPSLWLLSLIGSQEKEGSGNLAFHSGLIFRYSVDTFALLYMHSLFSALQEPLKTLSVRCQPWRTRWCSMCYRLSFLLCYGGANESCCICNCSICMW